jgi:dTMP kinase
MLPRKQLVVVEGIDGVGKSTISRALAESLDAVCLSSVCNWARAIAPQFVSINSPSKINTRLLFYLTSISSLLGDIRAALQHSDVILDRYFFSTLAYHRALGSTIQIDLSDLDFIEPDTKILLTASECVRRKRIENRGANGAFDFLVDSQHYRNAILTEFASFRMHEIDTSNKTVEVVVHEILDVMGRSFRG